MLYELNDVFVVDLVENQKFSQNMRVKYSINMVKLEFFEGENFLVFLILDFVDYSIRSLAEFLDFFKVSKFHYFLSDFLRNLIINSNVPLIQRRLGPQSSQKVASPGQAK